MFDIGWGELVVIGVVALIAIGPKELPGVLRTAGQWMGKIRRMASEFQGQFQEAMREAEMADVKKQVEETTSSFTNFDPLADTRKDLEKSFDSEPQQAASEPAAPLPPIDDPLPEAAPALTSADFSPAPAEPSPDAVSEPAAKKQAGGGA